MVIRAVGALAACCLLCACAPTGIDYRVDPGYAVDDPQFQRTISSLLGPPLIPGNAIDTYVNGDQIFPAMLEGIASAKSTITFETFVYLSGKTGHAFAAALAERAAAGVRVHVLIDAIGGMWLNNSDVALLRRSGAQVEFYHGLQLPDLGAAARMNHRTHRKVLIIDGTIGFTGGVGISDEWTGNADDPGHYRDTHYRVRGPVVAQMQAAFVDTWMDQTGRVLHDGLYFPVLEPAGDLKAQCFMSSYKGGSESMHLLYLLSVAAARHSVRLCTAYFVPDDRTVEALVSARARGARVQIIVPGPLMDGRYVRLASSGRWGPLLRAGVEIYEFQPTMYHTKLMIIDDLWTSVGSSNLDNRSFVLNEEANLNVMDPGFAAEQARHFKDDLARSKQVTYEAWSRRPLGRRIAERLAGLLRSQY